MVADALSHMTMGGVYHIEKAKKYLVRDIHSLSRLGMRLEDSFNGGFMVHHNSDSSLVVEVKSKHHLDQSWMKLKKSVLGRHNK